MYYMGGEQRKDAEGNRLVTRHEELSGAYKNTKVGEKFIADLFVSAGVSEYGVWNRDNQNYYHFHYFNSFFGCNDCYC